MLFEELSIDTLSQDNEIFVNVRQLFEHLSSATKGFSDEAVIADQKINFSPLERAYIGGLAQGMWSVVIMLQQGLDEAHVDSIQTVEDFLKNFNSE